VRAALEQLNERDREALLLKRRFQYDEIAETLGLAKGAIAPRWLAHDAAWSRRIMIWKAKRSMPHVDEGKLHALLMVSWAPPRCSRCKPTSRTCPACAARLDEARQLLAETEAAGDCAGATG